MLPQVFKSRRLLSLLDETVERFAMLRPASPDFRIFGTTPTRSTTSTTTSSTSWPIFAACARCSENLVYYFASTSKLPSGLGRAVFAASEANIAQIKRIMGIQTIGYDKLNQIRHVRYFKMPIIFVPT